MGRSTSHRRARRRYPVSLPTARHERGGGRDCADTGRRIPAVQVRQNHRHRERGTRCDPPHHGVGRAPEAFESLAREFAAAPDLFVRIDGETLDTAGFARGDIVAVRRQPEAQDGDIVLARIGPEVTLKRFQRIDAKHVELQPGSTNPEHEPIPIGPTTHDTEIVGIVVGAIVGRRRSAE